MLYEQQRKMRKRYRFFFPEKNSLPSTSGQLYLEAEDTHSHQQNHRSEKSGVTEGVFSLSTRVGDSKVIAKKHKNSWTFTMNIHEVQKHKCKTRSNQIGIAIATISTKRQCINLANSTRNPPLFIGTVWESRH